MGTERTRELRRRRHRRQKIAKLAQKAGKASKSEKVIIIDKLRKLTPGAAQVIERLGLTTS